jgi:hypothetical protein
LDVAVHDKELGEDFYFGDAASQIMGLYCESFGDAKKSKQHAASLALLEFLKAGYLPFGYNRQKMLLVYEPEVVKAPVKKASKKPSKKAGK